MMLKFTYIELLQIVISAVNICIERKDTVYCQNVLFQSTEKKNDT